MTTNISSFHQNYAQEKKGTDLVDKDIRKWVESVVEFKANLKKQYKEPPLEKHLKRIKKFKVKKKSSLVAMPVGGVKSVTSRQRKSLKSKKALKNTQASTEKPKKKEQSQTVDAFDDIKASFRNLTLPQNWTSGLSNGRVVFNRIKVTAHNSQQKMAVERSLVITKDCNAHILINGSEITLNDWQLQKIEKVDDIKRAIKDIDSLKISDAAPDRQKNSQSPMPIENKLKAGQISKSETINTQKQGKGGKPRGAKKVIGDKGVIKQKSFQK